jgi:hypothetical protein
VCKRVGHDAALGLLLEPIVADGRRGVEALLGITWL